MMMIKVIIFDYGYSETPKFNMYQIEMESNRIENVEKDRTNEFRIF